MPTLPKPKRKNYVPSRVAHSGNNCRNIYSKSRWKRTSLRIRQANPLCEIADVIGEVRVSEEVDHIISLSDGGAAYDERNLMAISRHYHRIKTGYEAHGIYLDYILTPSGKIPANREQIYILLLGDKYSEHERD